MSTDQIERLREIALKMKTVGGWGMNVTPEALAIWGAEFEQFLASDSQAEELARLSRRVALLEEVLSEVVVELEELANFELTDADVYSVEEARAAIEKAKKVLS